MMKKSIVLLLILSMVLSAFLVGCSPSDEPVDTPPVDSGTEDPVEDPGDVAGPPAEPMGEVIIGHTTELSGDWSAPYFQNNAADRDVVEFTRGYPTVDMKFDGEYVIDETVVESYTATENEDGSKTYEFNIVEGLTYDDGTPITAVDYVTSAALWSSNVIGDLGGTNTFGRKYVGYQAFSRGESKVFPGVRLLGDYTFSVTIAAEELPYFYELANVSVGPTPLWHWTDETVTIQDDGEGVYFSDNFTVENFEENIYAARRAAPPSSGPYKLISFDESSKVAVLEVNDAYVGDFTGQTAKIKNVIYKKINNATALDELSTGAINVLSKTGDGEIINAGLDLVEKGGFNYINYGRPGYGKITFVADHGPTQFVEVRQAIAHLLDRNDFANAFTGGYGSVVNGPYGEALWFYQETRNEINQRVNQYPYSPEMAVELLEEGGWIYDENGNDYESGIRHKKLDDGTLMPLVLQWGSTEDNRVSELLVIKLQENPDLIAAGIKIEQTLMTFPELLNYLYREGEDPKYGVPTYHMYNLAADFPPIYDPTTYYTTDPVQLAQGMNDNYIIDHELESLSKAIALTDAEDRDGFKAKFVDYIAKWNELLPDLPLYSNIYHDFFAEKIQDYQNNPLVRINKALLYSYVTE